MRGRLDGIMIVVALAQAMLAGLLLIRPAFVLDAWPLPGTTGFTFTLLAAILAAAAASTLWAALVGEPSSYVGIALDYLGISAPLAGYLFLLDAGPGRGLNLVSAGLVGGAAFGAWLLWQTHRATPVDPLATPRLVRISFGLFVVGLAIVGALLVADTPDILPWAVTPELSVVVGLSFIGAACYFGFGVLRPRWANAGGQLIGFLAYDLVLLVPLVSGLAHVAAELWASLVVYTAVVVFSGVLAAWYLLVARETRIRLRH